MAKFEFALSKEQMERFASKIISGAVNSSEIKLQDVLGAVRIFGVSAVAEKLHDYNGSNGPVFGLYLSAEDNAKIPDNRVFAWYGQCTPGRRLEIYQNGKEYEVNGDFGWRVSSEVDDRWTEQPDVDGVQHLYQSTFISSAIKFAEDGEITFKLPIAIGAWEKVERIKAGVRRVRKDNEPAVKRPVANDEFVEVREDASA